MPGQLCNYRIFAYSANEYRTPVLVALYTAIVGVLRFCISGLCFFNAGSLCSSIMVA